MYYKTLRIISKLVCLSKQVKVTDNLKGTNLFQNMSILCKLRICNFLLLLFTITYYNT
jgi:hypothetical protein